MPYPKGSGPTAVLISYLDKGNTGLVELLWYLFPLGAL